MLVIGMMSGTSVDAVDAGAVELELSGDTLRLRPLGLVSQPYEPELLHALVTSLPPHPTTMEQVCRLDTGIGQAFAELAVRANAELCDGRAELVVAHGQTVFHWTDGDRVRGTLQLGQPSWIAERTGLTVVSDLRSRDVAAGGQGAPLVSALDVLWLRGRRRHGAAGSSAALNLGGIANVTVVGADTEPLAFDTGPANSLIDAAVQEATAGRSSYDLDGALAARGQIHPELLAALLSEPYYARPGPKSTGKELFNLAYLHAHTARLPPVDSADLVATVTALTAHTVAAAIHGAGADEVIASGGGTRNPTLMSMLRDRLQGVPLQTSDELGLPAAAKEAYAFAVLGFLTMLGLPAAIPSCTGARRASVLGSVTPGGGSVPDWTGQRQPPTVLEIHSGD